MRIMIPDMDRLGHLFKTQTHLVSHCIAPTKIYVTAIMKNTKWNKRSQMQCRAVANEVVCFLSLDAESTYELPNRGAFATRVWV